MKTLILGGVDQSSVDSSTEGWLDEIEERTEYKAWFCGHWHTNKRIDKMHFLCIFRRSKIKNIGIVNLTFICFEQVVV